MFMTTLIKSDRCEIFFETLKRLLGNGEGFSFVGKKWIPWNTFVLESSVLQEAFGEEEVGVSCSIDERKVILQSEKRREILSPNKSYMIITAEKDLRGEMLKAIPAINGEMWKQVLEWLENQAKLSRS
jgi:hypothetical protein